MRASLRVWSQVGLSSVIINYVHHPKQPAGHHSPQARIKWFDGWENHKLLLDNYNSGPLAPYNSWVLLAKVEPGE